MVTKYPDGMRSEDWALIEGNGLDRVANRIIDTLSARGVEDPTPDDVLDVLEDKNIELGDRFDFFDGTIHIPPTMFGDICERVGALS